MPLHNGKKIRSIGAKPFNVPVLLFEKLNTDTIQAQRLATRKFLVKIGTKTAMLCCPQCRMRGYTTIFSVRGSLRAHLLDHRIARALGTEDALLAAHATPSKHNSTI